MHKSRMNSGEIVAAMHRRARYFVLPLEASNSDEFVTATVRGIRILIAPQP